MSPQALGALHESQQVWLAAECWGEAARARPGGGLHEPPAGQCADCNGG